MSDKKISLIMPVYHTEKFLRRAIKSIISQDYKNWELIVVMDGKQPKCEEIVKSFEKRTKKISHITIKHGGACAARNAGAERATGDVYSFFSSDFKARPGMLSTWMRYFRENPDCDFVYGGYGLLENGKIQHVYPSREFNAYRLTCHNYIDGGFPVKKEAYIPWDINCKSLNDWEWIIGIVKNGSKGYFMEDITYDAEMPRKDGLSFDSSQNWKERESYIKKKHKIPNRKTCVVSFGAQTHAIRTAELLGYDFNENPMYKPNDYERIYVIGFFFKNPEEYTSLIGTFMQAKDIKKTIHWIGSDVMSLATLKVSELEGMKREFGFEGVKHVCQSEQLKKELAVVGIKATVVPLPLDTSIYEVTPLPEKPVVAVYAPWGQPEVYNEPLMNIVALNMPDVLFKFYGDKYREGMKVMNVEYAGHVKDFKDLIKESSCILRYTRHDGFPVAPCEFILSGRNVVTNVDMPKINPIVFKEGDQVTTIVKDIINTIRETIDKPASGSVRRYYKKYLDPKRVKAKLEAR